MRMLSQRRLVCVAVTAWLACSSVHGFSNTAPLHVRCTLAPLPMVKRTPPSERADPSEPDNNDRVIAPNLLRSIIQSSKKKFVTPVALGLLSTVAPLDRTMLLSFRPKAAQAASAPVMAPPRRSVVDAETQAMFDVNKRIQQKNEEEMKEYQNKAREIAASQGEAARARFEEQWEASRKEKAEEKAKGLETLKRDLLDQGIDPWIDIEGMRQVMLYEKGVDLAEVPGTKFYMEKDFQQSQYKRSMKYQKQAHRFIIKSMTEDMKKRGVDPLQYFDKNREKTADILNMSTQKAIAVAEQYQANIKEYGQITKPKPGELLQKVDPQEAELKAKAQAKEAAVVAKQQAKEAKAKAKAEAKAKKAELAAIARNQKEKAKEEARLAKEAAKEKKSAAKAAVAATATGAAAAGVSMGANTLSDAVAAIEEAVSPDSTESVVSDSGLGEALAGEIEEGASVASDKGGGKSSVTEQSGGSPLLPVAAFVVAAGGGSFAIKMYQEKRQRDEEERQRQFRLIMGADIDKANGDKGVSDFHVTELPVDLDDNSVELEEHNAFEDSPSVESDASIEPSAPKKKKRGIRSMFGKKNANDREVDLNVLVGNEATAPAFALLLAKLLTFGAPGRFPRVTGMKGSMPMEEFDLEAAKEQLTDCGTASDISKEEAAEVFANVVNCMLIDIVDLASSSLKEDDKVTVDAINVVVDFMNHAASMYDSIAEGVIITPVTYGGTLARSKLEQMYSKYAISGMMTMDDNFNARVGLLQDVFGIPEKKAEGLMMKAMQKNMMKMMKGEGGEGMEGMEEMVKAMGGMEGMEGLEGLAGMGMDGDEGPNPEQLKEMLRTLKTMKDSGTIPPDELDAVRSQFREAFGSSIEEVMKDADKEKDALGETDKELLDLMKSILDD